MVPGLLSTLCVSILLLPAGAVHEGWDDCLKHSTSPEQCTCLQWFALSTAKEVDKEDVKQGFRFFAKHAHPDKHLDDKDFWTKIFRFGRACKDFLAHNDRLQHYKERITRLQMMARKKSWSDGTLCAQIEILHDELRISSDGSSSEPLKPRFEKREGPAEKVHLFLDDSGSMKGPKLSDAKEAVQDIMPRLERSPTAVHLIGPREYSQQIFGLTDDFVFDDISKKWQAPGAGTFLWQYIYQTLRGGYGHDEEVVIVTDGYDNGSEGDFYGTHGFNHMMRMFKELKRPLPRITVLCIGNDECTKAKYQELAMASGGDFFQGKGGKGAFVEHMLLTHSERVTKAALQQKKYAKLTAPEDRFDWFLPAIIGSKKGQAASEPLPCKDVEGVKVCSRKA